jgi:DNA polymerase-3 subunit beta
MRLVCDREEFATALGTAAAVVPSRTPRPVLENVLLTHTEGRLEITATDLEVAARTRVERFEAEGGDWQVLVPASRTLAIVRELEGPRIELEETEGVLTVRSEGSTFSMVAGEPGDYPQVEDVKHMGEVTLDAEPFSRMLRRALIAVAVDSPHYALTGVLFEICPEHMRLVSTDGKRMSLCERVFENPVEAEFSRVVPTKGVQLLAKLADGEGEPVTLRLGEANLACTRGQTTVKAQLVQGQFPPYEQVMPSGLDRELELGRDVLLGALRRAALVTDKDSNSVRMSFGHNLMTLSARTPDVGESRVEVPVLYEHDPLELGFNPRFLIDALRVMDAERVTLSLGEAGQPALLTEPGGFRYVVMPMEFD